MSYNQKEAAKFIGCAERTIRRYVKEGKLPFEIKGKTKTFSKEDLLKVASQLQVNKEKHRPDQTSNPTNLVLPPIEIVTNKDLVLKAIRDNPLRSLLNETGSTILMDTTKYLKKNGLLKTTNKHTIMRYAIAVQMQEKYQITAEVVEDKYFHDLVKQYGAEIKHYEKELGLTPAALSKIKPKEDDEPKDVDPMDALLSGK